MKRFVIIIIVLISCSSILKAQNTSAGSFLRMGFGAKGIGLGNAGVAVSTTEELNPFYNPSLLGYNEHSMVGVGYTNLSLNRLLNFAYGYAFINEGASIGFSFINAGVTDIDYRDVSGEKVGTGFTSDNALIISYGQRLSFKDKYLDGLSFGVSARLYLQSIYSSSIFGFGLDAGAAYRLPVLDSTHFLTVAVSVTDIISKTQGYIVGFGTMSELFPLSIKSGFSYEFRKLWRIEKILFTSEMEYLFASRREVFLKFGLMVEPIRYFKLRTGVDQIGLSGVGVSEILRWSFGVSVSFPIDHTYLVAIDYTFIYDVNSPVSGGIISVGLKF